MAQTSEIVLQSKKPLWIGILVVSLIATGTGLALLATGGSGSLLPRWLVAAVGLGAGTAGIISSGKVLRAGVALRVSPVGLSGWHLENAQMWRIRVFDLPWSEMESAAVTTRGRNTYAVVRTTSGRELYLDPTHISGFGETDADVIVGLIERGRE